MLYAYNLIVKPLELIVELVFVLLYRYLKDPGLAIIGVSLVVNILVLPIYKRADAAQEEERKMQEKMAPHLSMIRKAFSKDERYMMTTAYYREVGYRPIYAFRGVLPILLQIPFFIAAYHFLSHLQILEGASFGVLKDLSQPDGLFVLGQTGTNGSAVAGIHVNLLPILMTAINIISGAIYLKGFPLRNKIQTYGLALFFLVLLYQSPSGLVFYWTLNNLFSMGKNVVMKMQLFQGNRKTERKITDAKKEEIHNDVFVLAVLFLDLLIGFLIPSELIKSSVGEFVIDISVSPIRYVLNCAVITIGMITIWAGIFYCLANRKIKNLMLSGVFCVCGLSIVNYMCFGNRKGRMTDLITYENGLSFSVWEQLINIAVILFLIPVLCMISRKTKLIRTVLISGIIAVFAMCAMNTVSINKQYEEQKRILQSKEEHPRIAFSKNGKNVLVFMIDSAVGALVPYIFDEKPELKEQFDGFVFYPNTMSFGGVTHYGAPPLFGGYEYTPEQMNERRDESLAEKHNEAVKLMPELFYEEGYHITVADIPYAGYKEGGDLSIYDEYGDCEKYHLYGNMNGYYDSQILEKKDSVLNRNFFFYSLLRVSPLCIRRMIYNGGLYNEANAYVSDPSTNFGGQITEGLSVARNYTPGFLDAYNVLDNLGNITVIDMDLKDNFIMLQNQTPHEHCLLQKPDYRLSSEVDNTVYDTDLENQYVINGVKMHIENIDQVEFYHSNIATYIMLGSWFDYLREQGVYDNTRIILAADHGNGQCRFENMHEGAIDAELYNPLLMVKDFNSHGFSTSEEFMTNADVPTITLEGLIDHPVNPFTGMEINSDPKLLGEQHIIVDSTNFYELINDHTFPQSTYLGVAKDIRDMDNWRVIGEK